MNILEAPNIQQYTDPTQWIRDKILPVKTTCGKCSSVIIIDAESDLYITQHDTIGFKCMVCGDGRHWTKPTKEENEERAKEAEWATLSDEEYENLRISRIRERAQIKQKYLDYSYENKEERDRVFNEWNSVERRRRYVDRRLEFPTFEKYLEEEYLPVVPPETKPGPTNRILLHYDDVLEYYKKNTLVRKVVESATPSSSSSYTTQDFMVQLVILCMIVLMFVTALY